MALPLPNWDIHSTWTRHTVRPILAVAGAVHTHVPLPYSLPDRIAALAPRRGGSTLRVNGIECKVFAPPCGSDVKVLYLHGGGLVTCGVSTHHSLAKSMGPIFGDATVVMPNYKPLPHNSVRDIISACVQVYAEMGSNVVVAGDSAGGFLVFKVLEEILRRGMAAPAACYAMSPMSTLEWKGRAASLLGKSDPLFPASALKIPYRLALKASSRREDMTVDFDYLRTSTALPPILVQAAAKEYLAVDAQELADRVPGVELELYPCALHVFQFFGKNHPHARKAAESAGAFHRRIQAASLTGKFARAAVLA